MPEITKEQIELAKKICDLRMKVEGEHYCHLKYGDWVCEDSDDSIFKNRPAVILGSYKDPEYIKTNLGLLLRSKCFPIPSWQDCRALLREMGWHGAMWDLGAKNTVEVAYWHSTLTIVYPVRANATTDLEAIMRVVIEVLERKVKEGEDG